MGIVTLPGSENSCKSTGERCIGGRFGPRPAGGRIVEEDWTLAPGAGRRDSDARARGPAESRRRAERGDRWPGQSDGEPSWAAAPVLGCLRGDREQDLGRKQGRLAADWAELGGLVRRGHRATGRDRGGCLPLMIRGQESAAQSEFFLAATVGEKAEATDAHEAFGQDVKQESANELGRLQRQGPEPPAAAIVLPAKGDAASLKRD